LAFFKSGGVPEEIDVITVETHIRLMSVEGRGLAQVNNAVHRLISISSDMIKLKEQIGLA